MIKHESTYTRLNTPLQESIFLRKSIVVLVLLQHPSIEGWLVEPPNSSFSNTAFFSIRLWNIARLVGRMSRGWDQDESPVASRHSLSSSSRTKDKSPVVNWTPRSRSRRETQQTPTIEGRQHVYQQQQQPSSRVKPKHPSIEEFDDLEVSGQYTNLMRNLEIEDVWSEKAVTQRCEEDQLSEFAERFLSDPSIESDFDEFIGAKSVIRQQRGEGVRVKFIACVLGLNDIQPRHCYRLIEGKLKQWSNKAVVGGRVTIDLSHGARGTNSEPVAPPSYIQVDYEVGGKLGSGSYGDVYLTVHHPRTVPLIEGDDDDGKDFDDSGSGGGGYQMAVSEQAVKFVFLGEGSRWENVTNQFASSGWAIMHEAFMVFLVSCSLTRHLFSKQMDIEGVTVTMLDEFVPSNEHRLHHPFSRGIHLLRMQDHVTRMVCPALVMDRYHSSLQSILMEFIRTFARDKTRERIANKWLLDNAAFETPERVEQAGADYRTAALTLARTREQVCHLAMDAVIQVCLALHCAKKTLGLMPRDAALKNTLVNPRAPIEGRFGKDQQHLIGERDFFSTPFNRRDLAGNSTVQRAELASVGATGGGLCIYTWRKFAIPVISRYQMFVTDMGLACCTKLGITRNIVSLINGRDDVKLFVSDLTRFIEPLMDRADMARARDISQRGLDDDQLMIEETKQIDPNRDPLQHKTRTYKMLCYIVRMYARANKPPSVRESAYKMEPEMVLDAIADMSL